MRDDDIFDYGDDSGVSSWQTQNEDMQDPTKEEQTFEESLVEQDDDILQDDAEDLQDEDQQEDADEDQDLQDKNNFEFVEQDFSVPMQKFDMEHSLDSAKPQTEDKQNFLTPNKEEQVLPQQKQDEEQKVQKEQVLPNKEDKDEDILPKEPRKEETTIIKVGEKTIEIPAMPKTKEEKDQKFFEFKKEFSNFTPKQNEPKHAHIANTAIAVAEPEQEKEIDAKKLLEEIVDVPKTEFSKKQIENFVQNTLVVVLKDRQNPISTENVTLLGKTIIDFVKTACTGFEIKTIEAPDEANLLAVLSMLANDKKTMVVLYSDTPLLKRQTFLQIVDYFTSHNMFVLKLLRGFVFQTEYLKQMTNLSSCKTMEFCKEDFLQVCSPQTLSGAFEIMHSRIIEFHKQNGVLIYGEQSVFVDADVDIDENVIIEPNTYIKHGSVIQKGAKILSGSVVDASVVCSGAVVNNAHIENSIVRQNESVAPYTYYKNVR